MEIIIFTNPHPHEPSTRANHQFMLNICTKPETASITEDDNNARNHRGMLQEDKEEHMETSKQAVGRVLIYLIIMMMMMITIIIIII